ncbi:MAG: hypothetical protein JJE34_08085 [Alphaproteobacteria bacterium]|nr:hypothetical protein [Alphaproteobacteria bacterium]
MSPVLADIIGLLGSACIVGAYAYNIMAARADALAYNIVNLLGAVLLSISLMVHYNLASLILEFVWSGFALLGIAKAVRARRRA